MHSIAYLDIITISLYCYVAMSLRRYMAMSLWRCSLIKIKGKLTTYLVNLYLVVIFLLLVSPCSLICQEHKSKTEKDEKDISKNFSVVTEVQPVPENLKAGFESIRGTDAGTYLKFLSSDLLEGRETASQGYKIAAEFVRTMFTLWGIQPAGDFPVKTDRSDFFSHSDDLKVDKKERGYFQEIELKEVLKSDSQVTVECQKGSQFKSKTFNPEIDYEFRSSDTDMFSAPIVFVGYGIQEKQIGYDEYGKLDIDGKIVMMFTGVPGKDNPKSPFNKGELKDKYSPPPSRRMMRHNVSPQIKTAQEKGAAAVILVESSLEEKPDIPKIKLNSRLINDEEPIYPGERRRMSLVQGSKEHWESLPTIRVSRAMADEILGYAGQKVETLLAAIEKDFKPHSFILPGVSMQVKNQVEQQLTKCCNVLGYIQGSDPELKNEVVIIGAHMDHLGKRGDYIFNGADDNGSGSIAVIEVAHAFAVNPVKPKRSVLFALWTGEEKGLLGSRYYTAHPFFPLNKTVAYINLDMVSREWSRERFNSMLKRFNMEIPTELDKSLDMKKFMSIQHSPTPKLKEALKENNRFVGLHVIFREMNQGAGGGGSDHASFSSQNSPWAAFFGAMTDDYHNASDSIEKVNLDILEKSARLTWLAAFSLANSK